MPALTEESVEERTLPALTEERNVLLPDRLEEESVREKLEHELKIQFGKDRQEKINRKRRTRINKVAEPQIILTKKVEMGTTHHAFFTEVCTASVKSSNIRWSNIVNLFNSPAGFKGKVYGKSNGASNTFAVFLKFQEGQLIDFLSESEFESLKEKAEPESREERKFLKNNGRLESYRLTTGESIATSFFTLHNPHPLSYIYPALLKRLRKQLDLLNLNPETVQSKK